MKSGSALGEWERERDEEASSAAESGAGALGDVKQDFFCLFDVDGRPRALVDFIPLLAALFETLGRGGENDNRFRLEAIDAINQKG